MNTTSAQVAPVSAVVQAKKAVKPTAGVSTKIDVSEQVTYWTSFDRVAKPEKPWAIVFTNSWRLFDSVSFVKVL